MGDPAAFCDMSRGQHFSVRITRPQPTRNKAFEGSPSRYAHKWTLPMLFVHGDSDNRYMTDNSVLAIQVCQRLGIESRLFIMTDTGHENRHNGMDETMIAWANKYC